MADVDMAVPSDGQQMLVNSKTQYQKEFKSDGAKCAGFIFLPIIVILFVTQMALLFQHDENGLHLASAIIGCSVATMISMLVYAMLYWPVNTVIEVNKNSRTIEVTYHMWACHRLQYRQESLDDVSEVVVDPVKSQYGIVGYVANIRFKSGASSIQLYKDKSDANIVEDFNEMSRFITGNDADNNKLQGNCDGGCGQCYCICCKNWGIVVAFFAFFALGYVAISWAMAWAMSDGKLFERD